MKTKLARDFPSVFYIGCASHALNLLFKDWSAIKAVEHHIVICKSIAETRKHSSKFMKEVENVSARMEVEFTTIKNFPPTRWGYVFDLLNSVFSNRILLLVMI